MASSETILELEFLFESSSSSSQDEEEENYLPFLAIALHREDKPKVQGYVETVVPLYNLDDFQRFFRMSKRTFEVICQQLSPFLDNQRLRERTPIPFQTQMMVFLWYVGSLEPLCRIEDRFNITEFSVLKICNNLCKLMLRHLKSRYIVWPRGQERQTVIDAFRDKRQLPDVLGAIDSTHIQIRPPSEHPQTYVNRKGYHSLILQCICREDMRYTHCFTGWPGSCHDSRVLKNSDLWQNGHNLCNDDHVIGDGGFPLKQWLMTPFRDNGHLTREQRHYNYCLSSTRQVVERSFSLLKGRFRKLQNMDVCSIEVAVRLIISCCILHNICIIESDDLDDYFNNDRVQLQQLPHGINDNDAAGILKRIVYVRHYHELLFDLNLSETVCGVYQLHPNSLSSYLVLNQRLLCWKPHLTFTEDSSSLK